MSAVVPPGKRFNDAALREDEWKDLLENLIDDGLLSWKEIATLTLGHINPSQVGTSLASSEGFKRRYGKGEVMSKVMEWFYQQDGKCHDCGTRLELQADHNNPREKYENRLDADFIENMVLRCRRCNVIKRPSHDFGGQTHLTAESALMWILFSFRARTLPDFVRMCRLYGMTMADVRMQEGWAMAHWLRKIETDRYVIDTGDTECQVLIWPDGGITRCWSTDEVPAKGSSHVWFDRALPNQHVLALACLRNADSANWHVHAFGSRVGNLPFSHYFPAEGAECLAISYTPPKRKKNGGPAAGQAKVAEGGAAREALALEQMAEEAAATPTEEIVALPEGAKINLMPPRGLTFLTAALVHANIDAVVSWTQGGNRKTLNVAVKSRGKKVCDMAAADLQNADFVIE